MTQFAKRIDMPTLLRKLEIRSDGNDDYTITLAERYRTNTINYETF